MQRSRLLILVGLLLLLGIGAVFLVLTAVSSSQQTSDGEIPTIAPFGAGDGEPLVFNDATPDPSAVKPTIPPIGGGGETPTPPIKPTAVPAQATAQPMAQPAPAQQTAVPAQVATFVPANTAASGAKVQEMTAPTGWKKAWNFEHGPSSCAVKDPGICMLQFSVPAHGWTIVTGSPMSYWTLEGVEDRLRYNAGNREVNVWVFYNPTDQTISISMYAWSGANSATAFVRDQNQPVKKEELVSAALFSLSEGIRLVRIQGNCTIQGCDPKKTGYAVFESVGNNKSTLKFEFDPVVGKNSVTAPKAQGHDQLVAAP